MQSKWQKEKETKIITKESQDYEIVQNSTIEIGLLSVWVLTKLSLIEYIVALDLEKYQSLANVLSTGILNEKAIERLPRAI